MKFLGFLFLTIHFGLHAKATTPECFKVTNIKIGKTLVLRESPLPQAKEMASVPFNESHLKNLGCAEPPKYMEGKLKENQFPSRDYIKWRKDNYWCLVDYQGTQGYAHGNYLIKSKCK